MKQVISLLGIVLCAISLQGQVKFDDYFVAQTLRIDFAHTGKADTAEIALERLLREPLWGGSQTQLLDPFGYGQYRLTVYDSVSGKEIYSRGYSNLFQEWRQTPEAKQVRRSFSENVVMPFPKHTVRIVIEERQRNTRFRPHYELYVNPANYFIEPQSKYQFPVKKAHYSLPSSSALDIVVLPEGYTAGEMDKFEADVQRFVGYFFAVSPFDEYKEKVNFWAVLAPSVESGTDVPGEGVWRNTLFNTHFHTFHSARYLTTSDMRTVRDVASLAPYDQIYILVNTERYGGGGIFNYYNLCVSDNQYSAEVFTHEFGHAFAALADEYAYEDSPASELYDMQVEPWEVNITNLVNFSSKWADLVQAKTPIPTPVDGKHAIGAYEGAGYVKRGIYRPEHNCKMRTNAQKNFCTVCLRSVREMLKLYTE